MLCSILGVFRELQKESWKNKIRNFRKFQRLSTDWRRNGSRKVVEIYTTAWKRTKKTHWELKKTFWKILLFYSFKKFLKKRKSLLEVQRGKSKERREREFHSLVYSLNTCIDPQVGPEPGAWNSIQIWNVNDRNSVSWVTCCFLGTILVKIGCWAWSQESNLDSSMRALAFLTGTNHQAKWTDSDLAFSARSEPRVRINWQKIFYIKNNWWTRMIIFSSFCV